MRTRTEPLDHDVGPHYVAVKLDTRDMPVHLRKPFPARGAGLIRWMHETQRLALEETRELAPAEDEEDPEADWTATTLMHEYLAAIQGRIVGMLWAHRDHELEATGKTYDSPSKMGQAVYEELFDAGWSDGEIFALYEGAIEVCYRAASSRFDQRRVGHLVNFGVAPPEKKITPGSRRGSSTTAIPLRSTS